MVERILYCALNWGLGHASRSVPIIQDLLSKGKDVTLASDGVALELLKKEFPSLPFEALPPYDIKYKHESITLNILSQSFKILRAIKEERKHIASLVEKSEYASIISDNRFGCYHPSCKNIYITHQIKLIHRNRFIQASGTHLNRRLISKFDECWVPDYADENSLSGSMSHGVELEIPIKYIGPRSRFEAIPSKEEPSIIFLAILSGPEPQRSILQEIVSKQCKSIPGRHVIVTGRKHEDKVEGNVEILGLRNVDEISSLLADAKFVLSRAGYSSLMDYSAMKRRAIIIPTPGQTEQEYLAKIQKSIGNHIVRSQENIDLEKITQTNS